jgi:benzoate membrane transport protein
MRVFLFIVMPRMSFFKDVSISTVFAGAVTVMVGFTSSVAVVFHAAQSAGANAEQMASWIWALGLGMGITCVALSWRYKQPVVTAWSTPGAAMLITAASGMPMAEVVGAFVVSSLLVMAVGFSGVFERFMHRIPLPLAAGMLAGVLLRLGLDVFVTMSQQWPLPLLMTVVYLLARRWQPRYAVVLSLLAGTAMAAWQGDVHWQSIDWQWAQPVWVTPSFSVAALIGMALPLFIITMAAQNIPGVAAMKAHGYAPPLSPVMGWIGVVNVLLAPFGAFALNLAAITASICSSEEAHADKAKRYTAAMSAGMFYILMGLAGASVVSLFAALPKALVMVIAGLALFGTIANALANSLQDISTREPALITFLVTASGFSLWGIGAAFWGLVAGGIAWGLSPHPKA